MTLYYGKYTIIGTVDEIREFISKEQGTTTISNSIISELDEETAKKFFNSIPTSPLKKVGKLT